MTLEHDYYRTLGVAPAADRTAIQAAYRRQAMRHHPDRGGSHETMVLVQEAWEVLSDDGRRARYDAARTAAGGETTQQAAVDAREARRRAEQYPRGWAEMEAVLNRVAADFTGAEHGSVNLGHDFRFPTAGKSVTGWAFILAGAILGGVFVSPVVYTIVGGVAANAPKGVFTGLCVLVAVALPVLGGAWLGAVAHKWVGEILAGDLRGRCPNPQCGSLQGRDGERCRYCGATAGAPPASGPSSGVSGEPTAAAVPPTPATAVEARVVGCEKCGQKLRVPALSAELDVTCTSCRHKFGCKPPA